MIAITGTMADRSFASEAAQRLAALYARVEVGIVSGIAGWLLRGIAGDDWAERRMVEVGAVRRWAGGVLASFRPAADREARTMIGAALAHGVAQGRPTGRVYRSDPDRYLTPLNERLRGAERRAADAAAQAYRRAVLAGGLQLTGTGSTELARRRSVQRALNQAMAQGITGFTDRAGRSWALAGYVEMAAQTAATEAVIGGQLGQMASDGQNLIIVSAGPQECERCRQWMGKILTRDGSGSGGATLVLPSAATPGRMVTVRVSGSFAEARQSGLFHPRCRCRIGVYRVGLTGRPVTRPDPEGQKARDRLRELERRVRALRLREAAAMDGPALGKARAARQEAQKRVAAHVAETRDLGIRRDTRRESLNLGLRVSGV
jgi:hypothetical protein